MYHARYNVAGLQLEIIVRSIYVAWHDRCENVLVFVMIRTICDVDQSLSIAVAKIWIVRWSIVNLLDNV